MLPCLRLMDDPHSDDIEVLIESDCLLCLTQTAEDGGPPSTVYVSVDQLIRLLAYVSANDNPILAAARTAFA